MPGAAAKRHHGDILRAAGLLVYLLICVLVFVACGRADVSAGLEPPGNITENRDTDTDTDANAKAEALKGRISSVLPAEDPDGRTVILYFGDAQPWQSVDEYASFGALVNLARTISPDADFALQCGDMVNGGDIPEEWGAFMDAAAPALMGLPLLAAPGNHEVSPYVNESGRKPQFYLDVFELPENGPEGFEEEYYSVDFGSVHVISLSANYLDPAESYSDDKAENAQIAARIDDWIAQDLSETGRPWKIVLMHQPAFTYEGDSTQAAMLARWVPIFERTGVDLILCGHQHQISRSYPLRGGVEDMENGIVQIMGNASVKAYTSSGMAHPQFAFEAAGVRGWHRIVAGSRALSVTAYDSDGRALDVWEKIAAA
jgi:3',5'-cyclic AMP phosphodiesterase CpdA